MGIFALKVSTNKIQEVRAISRKIYSMFWLALNQNSEDTITHQKLKTFWTLKKEDKKNSYKTDYFDSWRFIGNFKQKQSNFHEPESNLKPK